MFGFGKKDRIDTTSTHNEEYRTYTPIIPTPFIPEAYKFGPEAKARNFADAGGYDLWRWPEWQALATRLGIDLGAPTTRLTISIPCDDSVKIVHEFNGLDLNTPTERYKEPL